LIEQLTRLTSARSQGRQSEDPSRRRRRSIRLATASVIAGTAIGATIELAVAHWQDSDFAQSPVATSVDEEPLAEATAIQAVLGIPVASARPSTSAASAYDLTATRSQAFCKDTGAKDLAAEFLNPACGSAKPHARHSSQTTSRLATVIVGRVEPSAAPAAAEPMPVTAAAVESSYTVVSAGKTVIPTAHRTRSPRVRRQSSPSCVPLATTLAICRQCRHFSRLSGANRPHGGRWHS
jgi:hypothetical protein